MPNVKQPPIIWQGKSIDDLPLETLHKLRDTLKHHMDKRAATHVGLHPAKFKRTQKLKIDFKKSDNGYLNQLNAAVIMAIARKKNEKVSI